MTANRCDRCANFTRFCRCDEPAPEPEPAITRRCTDCGWHMAIQYGYSNWTVEGSYIHCRRDLLPATGIDDWYGEDKQLGIIATACPDFCPGAGGTVDVDREDIEDLTPEQRSWYDAWVEGGEPS